MGETETLTAIDDEIQSIVSDQLQVVSYKWLSRNFSVSSNAAKSLLHEFVEKYGNGLEVIYSVSGWLKDNPSTYHVRLVSKHTLSDAKQEFDGNCSVQVYSIQACLPKDPATLWNHEFVQAEDLFKQPLTVDNCLRSNIFCGVSSSFITRNVDGKTSNTASPQVKITEESDLSKSNNARQAPSVPQPQLTKVQQPSPSFNNVKIENHAKKEQGNNGQFAPHKEKLPQVLPDKKKDLINKNSSGSGSALASMWGRASTKSKPDIPLEQPNDSRQKSAATADAQISFREEVEYESSDEDGRDFKLNRGGGGSRQRRVLLDYSDEDDEFQDAVHLASPDPPKKFTPVTMKSSVTEISLNFKEKENKPDIKEVKEVDVKPNKEFIQEISDMNIGKKEEPPISDNISSRARETDDGKRNNVTNAGHKKRKVVKTRIDERGREVAEVVWEGNEPDTKPDIKPGKIVEETVNNDSTRPNFVRKSPAAGNIAPANQPGKSGNKKGGKKDPKSTDHKQGNILSFFKKA